MSNYHMRRKEREIADRRELERLLKNGKYAVIAMCRHDEPYVVTLSYGYDEASGSLYFHCALKGLKIDFITDNPRVCATIIQDGGYVSDQCEHHYASLVMRGRMSVVRDLDEKKQALDVLLNHLERRPGPIKERNIKSDASYDGVAMLRLQIAEMTGKKTG